MGRPSNYRLDEVALVLFIPDEFTLVLRIVNLFFWKLRDNGFDRGNPGCQSGLLSGFAEFGVRP